MLFKDRVNAGEKLAKALEKYKNQKVIIFALPRGGVVIGVEIAKRLNLPLDLVIPRKIGHPLEPVYAIGAVAENGHGVFNNKEIDSLDKNWLKDQIKKEQEEAKRRRQIYLAGRTRLPLENKIAILVDDGIATGLTMQAAIKEVKHRNPKKIVVAVPIIPKDTFEKIKNEADEFIALNIPEVFLGGIGAYYEFFPQISDEEVVALMKSIE